MGAFIRGLVSPIVQQSWLEHNPLTLEETSKQARNLKAAIRQLNANVH